MKTHSVNIFVKICYDIQFLPNYCTAEAAAKMVELALDNAKGNIQEAGHVDAVLGLKPSKICIEGVEAA